MLTSRSVLLIFWVAGMSLRADVASSQTYPNKPIRMLASEPGGSVDFAARLIGPAISGLLGQPVIVDNRGGMIPIEGVAKAPPDGYTLLIFGSSIWLLPLIQDNVTWDPLKDFSPITVATTAPLIVVVHPSLPAKSVRELITFARSRPGALNYGSSGAASSNRLAAELFKAMAGVNIVRINYRGVGPALNAAIAGEVQLVIAAAGGTTPHVKSGRLRALAVTSSQPSALAPGLPTVAATGLPGYEYTQVQGILAPAGTPATIVSRLNQEIVRALSMADVKERFISGGVEPVGSSPEQLTATMKSDMIKLGKVIKDVGIRAD